MYLQVVIKNHDTFLSHGFPALLNPVKRLYSFHVCDPSTTHPLHKQNPYPFLIKRWGGTGSTSFVNNPSPHQVDNPCVNIFYNQQKPEHMKKMFFYTALVLSLLSSCQKEDIRSIEEQPVLSSKTAAPQAANVEHIKESATSPIAFSVWNPCTEEFVDLSGTLHYILRWTINNNRLSNKYCCCCK